MSRSNSTHQDRQASKKQEAQEQDLLASLLGGIATIQMTANAIVRNQIRLRRGERIAPPIPSSPNPQVAGLDYQMRDLRDLLSLFDATAGIVMQLQEANKAESAALRKRR